MRDSSREFRPDLAKEIEYLLGQMPRVDRETFQGLLIENHEVSDRVAEAGNELFDAYVRGDMPSAWRPAFEERLLSTDEGKSKLAVARKLVAKAPASRRGWWRLGAMAAAIAMVAGILPTLRQKEIKEEAAPVQRVRRIEAIELRPVTRGEAVRMKFALPPDATHVEFKGLEDPGLDRISLSTLQGRELWSGTRRPFLVPADLLPPGPYLVTAFDATGKALNYYEFEVPPR